MKLGVVKNENKSKKDIYIQYFNCFFYTGLYAKF